MPTAAQAVLLPTDEILVKPMDVRFWSCDLGHAILGWLAVGPSRFRVDSRLGQAMTSYIAESPSDSLDA